MKHRQLAGLGASRPPGAPLASTDARLHLRLGRFRLRILTWELLAVATFAAAALALWPPAPDGGPEAVVRPSVLLLIIQAALLFGWCAAHTATALGPVAALLRDLTQYRSASPAQGEAAGEAALTFPVAFTASFIAAALSLFVAGAVVELLLRGGSVVAAVQQAAARATLCAALIPVQYLLARHMTRPVLEYVGKECASQGVRISARTKLVVLTLALISASSPPLAMHWQAENNRRLRAQHQSDLVYLNQLIAAGAQQLGPQAFAAAVATSRLRGPAGDVRIRLSDGPADGASPLPAHHAAKFVATLAAPAEPPAPLGLVVTLAILLLLAYALVQASGQQLARDIQLITDRFAALTRVNRDPEVPGLVHPQERPRLRELAELADSLDLLMERLVEVNVTHWLAIEKQVEADRVKTQFLANVSHDLRSPLNSVLGFSELLMQVNSDGLSRYQLDDLRAIHRAGQELLWLINDVLDLAKLDAGRLVLLREENVPAEILLDAVTEARRRGIPEQVIVETELQAGLREVTVDPQRIRQALGLLIHHFGNTISAGKLVITVRQQGTRGTSSSSETRGRKLVTTLTAHAASEDASGIPVDDSFRSFRRIPGQSGLGLALPIARALLAAHEGALELDSTGPGVHVGIATIPIIEPLVPARMIQARTS